MPEITFSLLQPAPRSGLLVHSRFGSFERLRAVRCFAEWAALCGHPAQLRKHVSAQVCSLLFVVWAHTDWSRSDRGLSRRTFRTPTSCKNRLRSSDCECEGIVCLILVTHEPKGCGRRCASSMFLWFFSRGRGRAVVAVLREYGESAVRLLVFILSALDDSKNGILDFVVSDIAAVAEKAKHKGYLQFLRGFHRILEARLRPAGLGALRRRIIQLKAYYTRFAGEIVAKSPEVSLGR